MRQILDKKNELMEKQARIDEAKDVEKKNEDKLTQKAQKDPPADVVQTVPYDVDAALYEHYMQTRSRNGEWKKPTRHKTKMRLLRRLTRRRSFFELRL